MLPSLVAQRFVRRHSRTAHQVAARQSGRLDEVFHGIVPVKLNRLEAYQSRHYGKLNAQRVEVEVRTALGTASIPGLIDAMSGVGFLGVLIYGGSEIISGEKTVGEFMAFFTALGFAFEPLRRLGTITGVWEAAAAGIERVMDLLAREPIHKSPANPVNAPVGTPNIVLENVELSYGEADVLRKTSFVAPAGKTTALVGPSGAGKSTIFNILTRLTDPQNGQVLIGGVPVSEMALSDLRDLFSVVSQDALLFDETLRDHHILGFLNRYFQNFLQMNTDSFPSLKKNHFWHSKSKKVLECWAKTACNCIFHSNLAHLQTHGHDWCRYHQNLLR